MGYIKCTDVRFIGEYKGEENKLQKGLRYNVRYLYLFEKHTIIVVYKYGCYIKRYKHLDDVFTDWKLIKFIN